MADKTLEFIRSHFLLFGAVVGVGVAWGTLALQNAGNEKAIAKLETQLEKQADKVAEKLDKQADVLLTIQTGLAGIQATNLRDTALVAQLELRMRALENARQRRE